MLIGLSVGGLVTPAMLKTMAKRPIIFALANPDPEIGYDEAAAARPDAIVATGRSDFPNQVNNVLGFPFIFRGALDVHASGVSEEMKVAAAEALAELAREDVPDEVLRAYGRHRMRFGRDYIIPKPFDNRVLYWVAPAVARAAMESGVARQTRRHRRVQRAPLPHDFARRAACSGTSPSRPRRHTQRIVFPEGDSDAILRAAHAMLDAGIAHPVLLGSPERIRRARRAARHRPRRRDPRRPARKRATRRLRRSVLAEAPAQGHHALVRREGAAALAHRVRHDDGRRGRRRRARRRRAPALPRDDPSRAADHRHARRRHVAPPACTWSSRRQGVRFLADTTINIDPDAETLAEIAMLAADAVSELGLEPRVAMLSFSNFGDAPHPQSQTRRRRDGHRPAPAPGAHDRRRDAGQRRARRGGARSLPAFRKLKGAANVLIFPNLDAGNAAYKLLAVTGGADVIGPMVLGLRRPVNVLQQGASVDAIVHMTAITAAQAIRAENAR